MTFQDVLTTLLSLGGVASMIAVLVNVGKSIGWVKDGQAQSFTAILNLVCMAGLVLLNYLGRNDLIPLIDQQASVLASIVAMIFGYTYQLFISKVTHTHALAGTPVIGKSYTADRVKADQDYDRLAA